MARRNQPNLDRVRDAMREHDEHTADVERNDDARAAREAGADERDAGDDDDED